MNFHKSICTEQGYSIMLTIILSLRIWFGKKLLKFKKKILVFSLIPWNWIIKKKKKKDKRKKSLVRWLARSELEAWSVLKGQT